MVDKVRISVAMVTYNGSAYLKEQMDSILSQLEQDDEVVVSDDGSTDGTCKLLEAYADHDKRIRILNGPQKGIKKNVEHVLRHCRGAYIYLADQDDIWMPHKVKRIQRAFEQEHCALVIHDARVFEDEPENTVMESFFAFRKAGAGVCKNMIKNSYIGCCMAFRSETRERLLPIPKAIEMHDQWIGVLSDFYNGKSCFLQESLLNYRRHGNNNSQMKHYGFGKMLRNRCVFTVYFLGRIFHIY